MMALDLFATPAWAIGVLCFVGTLLFAEIGFQQGHRLDDAAKTNGAWGVVESAILGLMAFLLGFAFSFANGRYEARLDLEQKEVNAIGTAFVRIDLLDPAAQAPMRDLFRSYVDARLNLYRTGTVEKEPLQAARAISDNLQGRIWKVATAALHHDNLLRNSLFIQAVNDMFDNGGDVEENLLRRAPVLLAALLMSSVFLGGSCVGYGFGRAGARNVSAWVLFALITTLVGFVVMDLMRPERGVITAPHHALVRLQESLK